MLLLVKFYQNPMEEYPPSMLMIWPVTYEEAFMHRKLITFATSSGSPVLPMGVLESTCFL